MAPPYRQAPARRQPKLLRRGSKTTLATLVRLTAPADRQAANGVRLSSVVPMRPPSNLPEMQVMRGRTLTAQNTHEHTQRLFWNKDAQLSPSTPILVDCSCPRYAFYYEWANAQHGCGFIYRSNGDPPSTTNPRHQRGCCKHLVRFLSYLLRQTREGQSAQTSTTAAAPPRLTNPRTVPPAARIAAAPVARAPSAAPPRPGAAPRRGR